MNDLVPAPRRFSQFLPLSSYPRPSLAGERAGWRYVEFFTANINKPHTRRAHWHTGFLLRADS
jgi:hypothetical protein